MKELANRTALEAAITSDTPTLVWFSARWCKPCRRLDVAAIQNAAATSHLDFVHCDVDAVSMAVHICAISTIPTFVLYHSGCELGRIASSDTAEVTKWIAAKHTAR